MEWSQLFALGGYLTGVCYFFYRLSEKGIQETKETIKEWREEHKQQIDKMDSKWERLFERLLIQDQQKVK